MYIVFGILFLLASVLLLNWARARNGKPHPMLERNEFVGGIIVIVIIVTFTAGVTLTIMQFTG